MDYSPSKLKDIMEKNEFNLKKFYGQNFIIDENIINSIINQTEIDKDTLVLEVGPGAGALTYKLSKVAKRVLCYEIDNTLEPILKENLKGCRNVDIIFKDFLKCNVKKDLKDYNYKKLYVVSNLPYYITTPIILKIIEEDINVDKIVVMVQKEVGNRFKANPNTKDYGSLSVFIKYYFTVKKLLDVSKNVFVPKPNVDSIVVEFENNQNKYELKDKELFFKLVRDAFKQKRKTLKNNLTGYDLEKIESVLNKNGLDLNCRAEQLSINLFVEIANNL